MRRRDVLRVVLAAAGACMLAPRGASSATAQGTGPRLQALWDGYRDRFLTTEGRIVDDANGGISHSEGQGYALVLSALLDRRQDFDKVWTWTERELLVRDDGLASWRWDPKATPHLSDRNNASDGDLLIVWGLVAGAERWDRPDLKEAAARLAQSISTVLVRPSRFGPVIMPGAEGFSAKDQPDGPVVNLSYWVFPALTRCKEVVPGFDWDSLRHTGHELLERARFGPLRLPTDWISLAGAAPAPARKFKPVFGYNAIRIPLYLLDAGFPDQDLASSYASLWNEEQDAGPFEIEVETGSAIETMGGRGFKTVSAAARCVATGAKMPPTLLEPALDPYYPSTLQLLSLALLSHRYAQCL